MISPKTFISDSVAGMVVFLVALPLCLGIALASGVPLVSGIWAGILGGLVVGLLSGSSLSVSGPAAGLVGVVLGALTTCGSIENFYVAVVLSGVMQLALGALGLGRMVNLFPSSVIHGLLAAVGATIILKQWPVLYRADSIQPAILFVTSLFVYIAWENWIIRRFSSLQLIPAAMLSVLTGLVLIELGFPLASNDFVALPIAKDAFELIQITSLSMEALTHLGVWMAAISIALIGSVETLINLGAADSLDPLKRKSPPNRELFAQGIANVISGFHGGLPITSVVVRSSANIMAGAKTRWSAIFHSILLLIALFFTAQWMNLIPLASLSAVLVVVGYKLVKPSIFKEVYRHGKSEFIPFMVTFSVTLATDLLKGVIAGVIVSALILRRSKAVI